MPSLRVSLVERFVTLLIVILGRTRWFPTLFERLVCHSYLNARRCLMILRPVTTVTLLTFAFLGCEGDAGVDGQSCTVLNNDHGTRTLVCPGAEPITLSDGAPGAQGEVGADGSPGPQGELGITGADGADGADGVDGVDGADGMNGVDGTNGTDGAGGTDGADGMDGDDGMDGADGFQSLVLATELNPGERNCPNGGGGALIRVSIMETVRERPVTVFCMVIKSTAARTSAALRAPSVRKMRG